MEGRREGGGEGVGRAKKDRRRGRRRHLPAHEVLKLKICSHMAATGHLVYMLQSNPEISHSRGMTENSVIPRKCLF